MNMLALIVFPAIMAWAAASDLLTMRISNRLVLTLLAGFALMVPLTGMPLDILGGHALAGAVVLAGAFAFFAFGWIGGGDAKLAAVIALWLGWPHLLAFVAYSGLLGGVLTILILLFRFFRLSPLLETIVWVERLHARGNGVPYGIALAAAAMLIYTESFIFKALAI